MAIHPPNVGWYRVPSSSHTPLNVYRQINGFEASAHSGLADESKPRSVMASWDASLRTRGSGRVESQPVAERRYSLHIEPEYEMEVLHSPVTTELLLEVLDMPPLQELNENHNEFSTHVLTHFGDIEEDNW